jgi:ABC-type uncharacterized transport system auxiliary subunit
MVTHVSRWLAAALFLATTALGCSLFRAAPHVRYYTLTLSGAPPVPLEAPVTVGFFTADEPYATARLAYRSSPYRLDYYTYHRWASDPRALVRTAIRDYFERAATGTGTPFEIEGNVRRFEEIDDPSGWQGALALDVKVAHGGAIVLQHAYSETEPAEARNAEAVAAALSRALKRILDQVATDLARAPGAPAPTPPAAGR